MLARKKKSGFTIIELLIVVGVIGVIAAIAIPNLINAVHRGRQKRTMSDMRALATAIESYAVDNDAYPNTSGSTTLLASSLEGPYIEHIPVEDGWGAGFIYTKLGANSAGAEYILWSLGKGAEDDGNDGRGGETNSFASDIVMFDGQFTQFPTGVQK